jgi:hypothetical protein
MTTASLDTATKAELRILCKSAGVRGYGKMTCDQMRGALRAHSAPERLTNSIPVKVVAKNPASQSAARVRAKKAASKSTGEPSIREWLETQLAKGELKVADALAFAEKSGRSKVTVYRQARELSYAARKGIFVKVRS